VKVALVLAAAALLAASCGGGSKPAVSAADVAPFDTYALLSGNPDRVQRVLELLPEGRRLISLLAREHVLTGGGERIAVLDAAGTQAVALAPHADTKALDRDGIAHAKVRGWIVFSHQRAAVDAVVDAKRRLAEASWYRPAEGDVTLVRRSLTLTASRHGDREVAERTTPGAVTDANQELAGSIPDDAVAAAVFQRGAAAFSGLSFGPELERGLGLRVADLAAAAPGPGVVFLRPAEPVPTVTLLARGGTLAAARKLVKDLDPVAPPPVPASVDGVALEVAHLGATDLYYGRYDGTLVLTDDPGLRLRSSFTALAPSDLPERTAEWAYLDVRSGLPALQQLALLAATPLSAGFLARVSPLRSVLAYRVRRGERQSLVVVVR
jgi:hypothetical protein